MRTPTVRHRLEHLLFRVFARAVRCLPEGLAESLGGGLGWLVGTLFRVRRKVVDRHLRLAFPRASSEWRRAVARGCYRHLGREGVAMLRLADLDREAVRRRSEVVGLDALRAAVAEGRGVVVATGHLGNWEVAGAAVASRGVPLDAVALRQGNPLFDRDLVATREALGMRIVHKHEGPGRVLRSLREGRVVALVADQNPIRGGIPVEFFGRPANTARGAATLALRSGAPLFVGVGLRSREGKPRYRVELERVRIERTGDLDTDVRALVQAYTRRLEQAIRLAPEQYFWQHRRWKERH